MAVNATDQDSVATTPAPSTPFPDPPYEPHTLVYRWDLDKTYLRTEFDTMRDLVRTAFESAAQKKTVPGASALLREISNSHPQGIYILSGSPEQLRRVLERKLRLDGIHWDHFELKPQISNILRGRFRMVRDQVGYKLGVLLETRSILNGNLAEYCFGDDAEADAFIYSIYSDLCAGRVDGETLGRVLIEAGVYPQMLPRILEVAQRLPRGCGAIRIFIHLDRVSSPATFREFGPRVCPFFNYFQPALVLLEHGALTPLSVWHVASELVIEHGFTPDALVASYMDMVTRSQIGRKAADMLVECLDGVDDSVLSTSIDVLRRASTLLDDEIPKDLPSPPAPPPLDMDWVELFGRDKKRAIAAKLRSLGRT